MKIDKIHKRLIYIPDRSIGSCTFSGDLYSEQAVKDIIKEEGRNYIREKLVQIIEIRKELFGDSSLEFYGLHPLQRFFDLKSKYTIRVEHIIGSNKDDYILRLGDTNSGMLKSSNISNFRSIRSGTFWQWKD